MKIKGLNLKNPYFLAPMEGVNDIAFRLLCRKAGAGLTYTGMIHPQSKKKFYFDDRPALQLFCTTPKGIEEFMHQHDGKVSLWDFNLGCPATNAKKRGFGAYLHHDLKSIEKILSIMRNSTKKPLTIKIRESPHAVKIAKLSAKYCDAIAIHPRTKEQGYSGAPNLKFAKQIRAAVNLPIIYSGNALDIGVDKLLKQFDFIMFGRNAIGNPNLFSRLAGKKIKITFSDYLELAKKYKLPFRQIKFQAMNFTKGKRNSKKLRLDIFNCKTVSDIEGLSFCLFASQKT